MPQNNPPPPRHRISREVLEAIRDPVARMVWDHWLETGEAELIPVGEGP
jgi:hypothetical protein